jgi:Fe-S-cluster-containing hydrogenase component 2
MKEKNQSRRYFIKTIVKGGVTATFGGFLFSTLLPGQTTRPKRWIHRLILVDYDKCTGCRTCETVCSQTNHKVTINGETLDGLGNPDLSNIRVYPFNPDVDVPIVCVLCRDNPCIEACPVEPDEKGRRALYRDSKLNTITCNTERCIGCKSCAKACENKRVGAIIPNERTNKPERMCNLCNGNPQCVAKCPYDALTYIQGGFDTRHHALPPEKVAEELMLRWYPGVLNHQGGGK